MTREVITAREVASRIGHTPVWFSANRKKLEANHGFPKKIPGLGHRWNADDITAWLNRFSEGQSEEPSVEEALISRIRNTTVVPYRKRSA